MYDALDIWQVRCKRSCVWILFVGLLGTGCQPDPNTTESDETPTNPGDGDGDGEPGDGDGDGEPGDGDGDSCDPKSEIQCDDSCVDPDSDPENCGACGRTCLYSEDPFAGGCFEGECLPFYSDCVASDAGLSTCEEVCADSGQSCRDADDQLSCGIVAWVWTEGEGPACADHDWDQGATLSTLSCDDQLPFGTQCSADGVCEYVVCCCTQDASGP